MEVSNGIWTSTADVDLLLRLAGSGFDWLVLDAQHGPVDRAALHGAGRALGAASAPFLVRVPAVDAAWIGTALDAGAHGVVVPSVTGAEDAARAALACRYPPLGERSWGPWSPMWGASAPAADVANGVVRCWVMVETVGALDEVERIAATPGVDGLFVGPLDLALALGTSVEALLADDAPDGPLRRVVAAAERQGILVGAFAGNPSAAARLRAHGIGFLAVTTDAALLASGARTVLAELEG
ncbi:aldolase/citrate lyase family protein [Phycicoccus sp.]|uniref:HpcH/HpaI aldolase family protein n=1 Tax=Phycicoccus sp. TaxID=1902410 RepID=UPI002BB28136|nr:aldolase/citrate lyase family protein [Phycicoccus sp.]HMM95044.1 aldolase/citrate lyase family protein [Phycicoccus sp.]